MSRINWPNAAAYGVFTAAALGMVLWFARFVSERTGAISWTLLVVGLCAATAIVLYVIVRWFAGALLRGTAESVMQALARLGRRFESGAEEPVTREEFRAVQADLQAVTPQVLRLVGIAMTTMLLMGLLLQLVTLANGAVMYLQARRIEEQNALLAAQNRNLDAGFLNDSLNNVREISENIRATNIAPALDSGLLSPLGILGPLVEDSTGVALDGLAPVVCVEDQLAACNSLAFGTLSAMPLDSGRIEVTEEIVEGVRGFFHLAKAVEAIGLAFFTSLGSNETSLNDDLEAGSRLLTHAVASCGGDPEGRLIALWDGLSGAAFAANAMWPVETVDEIIPGATIDFGSVESRANFLGFGAGLGYLGQTMGGGDLDASGPQDLADLYGSALAAFEIELHALQEQCRAVRAELLEAADVLSRERSRMTRSLVLAQEEGR